MTAPSLDRRTFRLAAASGDGDVDARTIFEYHEDHGLIWARYSGGAVQLGFLVGTRDGDSIHFRYAQRTDGGLISSGVCDSIVSVNPEGLCVLDESWAWESRPGSGVSRLIEIAES